MKKQIRIISVVLSLTILLGAITPIYGQTTIKGNCENARYVVEQLFELVEARDWPNIPI